MLPFLKKIFSTPPRRRLFTFNVEELRSTFRARYHNFKLLLNANNKALEIMADIEQALAGGRPFSMSFIRANCTALSVNVFRIIQNLDELAPGKYRELYNRFRDIETSINQILSRRRLPKGDRLVISLREIGGEMADEVGNKMAGLGEIKNQLQISTPEGFVITALAYQRFFAHNDLQTEIDRRLQSSRGEQIVHLYTLSAGIQQLIIRSSIPPDLEEIIMEAYRDLEQQVRGGITVSLRSSALAEDSMGTSFAGQYRSELNVSAENIMRAYREVIASKYSLPAMAYRLNKGIRDEDIDMCVGCMVMVDALTGGVIYSRNPLDMRDSSIFINSAWGLPKSVVDGSGASDLFVVLRDNMAVVKKEIRNKEYKFVCYPEEGVCRLDLAGEKASSPSLTDDQVRRLAGMTMKIEEYYGFPQDIEWAISQDGAVYILQCRPLKQFDTGENVPGGPEEPVEKESVIIAGGITASAGVACGPVFIVKRDMDTLQFPEGAVLVTPWPLPRWAALLSRAQAVVTEEGSFAGHLATVAREFNVPALFGVPGATDTLKNNDLVTVDAEGRRIYKGRVEALLVQSEHKKKFAEGSPVYEILKEVSRYIVPLNLLDPDAPDFKPQKCRTFHDLTRFSHEKAVWEMFSFGKEHHFPERASKQLVTDVPMQFWVIDLDDGFKDEVEGRHVKLENISSIPMLALWKGITAIPWRGPPPVNAKGFLSILHEATTNLALDPSSRSSYAVRNYFMISKNFCSLHSRFGFHFSIVEALVGERALENYISFQFKGGAADYQRRVRRTFFVGRILEEFGFRTEVREDALFSRLEGQEEGFMKGRLMVIGYLIIHTRQLDMIMLDDASISGQRAKIMRDIHSILETPGPAIPNSPD
ncbi:MAG: PEP/pyruvate-binding domain-containing protein [Syntrophales bacterium]|nr:PEP/pyruvate-binding domain-containing protein [Syntrophales bacterium]